jgi:hypothetical protein
MNSVRVFQRAVAAMTAMLTTPMLRNAMINLEEIERMDVTVS